MNQQTKPGNQLWPKSAKPSTSQPCQGATMILDTPSKMKKGLFLKCLPRWACLYLQLKCYRARWQQTKSWPSYRWPTNNLQEVPTGNSHTTSLFAWNETLIYKELWGFQQTFAWVAPSDNQMKEEKPTTRKIEQWHKDTRNMKENMTLLSEKRGWSTLNLYEMIWELELASHPHIPTNFFWGVSNM